MGVPNHPTEIYYGETDENYVIVKTNPRSSTIQGTTASSPPTHRPGRGGRLVLCAGCSSPGTSATSTSCSPDALRDSQILPPTIADAFHDRAVPVARQGPVHSRRGRAPLWRQDAYSVTDRYPYCSRSGQGAAASTTSQLREGSHHATTLGPPSTSPTRRPIPRLVQDIPDALLAAGSDAASLRGQSVTGDYSCTRPHSYRSYHVTTRRCSTTSRLTGSSPTRSTVRTRLPWILYVIARLPAE